MVLYKYYPDADKDKALSKEVELAWVHESIGEYLYTVKIYDENFCLATKPPTIEKMAETFLTEPQVTFVTDAQGRIVSMKTALVVMRDI